MNVTKTGLARNIYNALNDHEPRMTYKELAQKSGVGESTIKMVLSDKADKSGNKRKLNTDDLFAIAKALDVSPYYLLTGIEEKNHSIGEELGLSNDTINALREMDEDTLKAMELLINDFSFSLEWAAYIFATDQGLWRNGRKIVSENEDVTVGNYGSFGGGYAVGTLVTHIREQNIISTLRYIRKKVHGK